MKNCVLLLLSMLTCVFYSCTENLSENITKMNKSQLSPDNMRKLLDETASNCSGILTKSVSDINYSLIKSYQLQCEDTVSKQTDNITISQYKIENNGVSGYSVVVDDNRFPTVLIYVPNGNLSDTSYVTPLNAYFRSIPTMVNHLYNSPEGTKASTRGVGYANNVNTEWHDSYPYNSKIPSSSTLRPLAGTHISAFAQACAHYKKGSYNWSVLLSSPTISTNEIQRVEQVSELYLNIANKTKTKYSSGSADVNASNILTALHDWGFKGATEISMRDFGTAKQAIFSYIENKALVIMRGQRYINNSYSSYDYWLVDACYDDFSGGAQLHCNWGTYGGLSNGLFLWLPNANLLTTGIWGFDSNSYRSIQVIGGIK